MKATIHLELEPFMVPSFVRTKTDLSGDSMTVRLCDLDSYALDALCDEFRNEVFRKAGKEQPPQQG